MRLTGTPRAVAALSALALSALAPVAPAAEQGWIPPTAEQIAARERIRPEVEKIMAELRNPPDGPAFHEHGPNALRRLVAMGPDVAPFLESEIELPDPNTYNVAAVALGLVGAPGAADALRKADDVADRQGGRFGYERRVVTLLGLACAGGVDAVTRVLSGSTDLRANELANELPLLDLVALHTYPASVDPLLAEVDRILTLPVTERGDLPRVVAALGALLDPRAIPKLLPLAGDSDVAVRIEAARALGRIGDARATDTLLALVRDADRIVARRAAEGIARIRPVEKAGAVVALLDHVQDPEVRVYLYRAVQGSLGPKAFDFLKPHAGRPDYIDRTHWLRAVVATGDRRAVPICRAALTDRDSEVTYAAVEGLATLGGEGAADTLLAVVGTRPWPLARTALDTLAERDDPRLAPRVADRLFREILRGPVTDPALFTPMRQMLETLVEFGYHEPAPRLRELAAEQPDGSVTQDLLSAAARLDRIRELGKDPARWAPLLASADAETRRLAIHRLARIGGPAALAPLEAAFASLGREDREELLAVVARRPEPAAGLFERALDDPAFDRVDTTPGRANAAWGARRLGGPKLIEALSRSANRTEGVDLPTLVYLAQLSGPAVLPELERLRLRRLRIPSAHRGEEQKVLDELITDLRAGRSIAALDLSPPRLHGH